MDDANLSPPREDDQVSRYQVCGNCKRLKRKCNLERPTCSRCRTSGLVCEYQWKKKKPGPAKGSEAPRTKTLNSRLATKQGKDHLESLVQGLQGQVPLGSGATPAPDYPFVGLEDQAFANHMPPSESMAQTPSYQISPQGGVFLDLPARPFSFDVPPFVGRTPLSRTDTSSSIHSPAPTTSGAISASTLNQRVQQLLISLFFEHVQPMFTMFRRPTFEQDFRNGQVPESLLNAMFALSSRFVPTSDISRVFGPFVVPWEGFAQSADEQRQAILAVTTPVCLSDIKTACLLAIYEYTNYPGRKAWTYLGNLVRLSLGARLHQVDCPNNLTGLSHAEKEEWRFVWWTVWKLDSTINALAHAPLGIDVETINTALVSTTVADFTNGIVRESTQILLEMNAPRSYEAIQQLHAMDAGDGSSIHLLLFSLLREVSLCQQRLYTRPGLSVLDHMMSLKNSLSCLQVALPPWYFDATKRPNESRDSHRNRLEVLIALYTLQLLINEPVHNLDPSNQLNRPPTSSLASWQASIAYAEELASVFHHWKPEYFSVADPIMSCAIWHAYCGLTVYRMAGFDQGNDDSLLDTRLGKALDLLSMSLESFARRWRIARILQEALKVFELWDWVQLDVERAVEVLRQCRNIDPYGKEPGRIDVGLICGASSSMGAFADIAV